MVMVPDTIVNPFGIEPGILWDSKVNTIKGYIDQVPW